MKNNYENKYADLINDLNGKLSKKRAKHCMNVAKEAVKLASKYDENEENAYLAGLLHDIMKEIEKPKMLEIINNGEYEVEEVELNNSALWHGIASAVYARQIGIDNVDILNAIRYHTVARENMSKLEKIVYLADLISEDRDYSDVDTMRKKAHDNLDDAMIYALCFTLHKQADRKGTVPLTTIKAYNYFINKKNG